jgi:hypothetical protein
MLKYNITTYRTQVTISCISNSHNGSSNSTKVWQNHENAFGMVAIRDKKTSTLKVEAACSCETLISTVSNHKTARCHIPEHHNQNNRRRQHLRTYVRKETVSLLIRTDVDETLWFLFLEWHRLNTITVLVVIRCCNRGCCGSIIYFPAHIILF